MADAPRSGRPSRAKAPSRNLLDATPCADATGTSSAPSGSVAEPRRQSSAPISAPGSPRRWRRRLRRRCSRRRCGLATSAEAQARVERRTSQSVHRCAHATAARAVAQCGGWPPGSSAEVSFFARSREAVRGFAMRFCIEAKRNDTYATLRNTFGKRDRASCKNDRVCEL